MKLKLYLNIAVALALTSCTSAHDSLYKEKPANYSYIIGNIEDSHIYAEHSADIYATPASCQKTITALIALKTLGPDYVFETNLYKSNKDIVVVFSGDPNLTSENLFTLLEPLRHTRVKGKIFLDASVFQVPIHSTNIVIGDIGTNFAQPVSGINIDKNLDLELKTSPEEIDPYILTKMDGILKTLNIKGKMEIIHDRNSRPNNLVFINGVRSEPIKNIIRPALMKSDNLVFDSIYLTITNSKKPEGIKDWTEGNIIMKDIISADLGVGMDNALIVDGSGLSRYNAIQPRQLLEILRQGYAYTDFVAAFPKPAEANSTLEKRTNLPSNIRAKTGNMLANSCLCGYSVGPTPKAFVIIASNFSPPLTDIFNITDKFIKGHLEE